MEFKYDPSFPIRGLSYDKLRGCLLKLDFFGSIEPDGCYYGRRKVLHNQLICFVYCIMLPRTGSSYGDIFFIILLGP